MGFLSRGEPLMFVCDPTDDWLDLSETKELAEEYISGYDPSRMKITSYTRSWAVQVTRVCAPDLVSQSRTGYLVDARMFWAHALWGAGYSYMQIARALHRVNHSTAHHLLTTKKFSANTRAYLLVSLDVGKKIGLARLEWLDRFRGDLELVSSNSRRVRGDYSKRRTDLMTLLERDLELNAQSRVFPVKPKPKRLTKQALMADLAERFRQELSNG
jgi:hypothetical protein